MKVVIVGAGEVGRHLSEVLSDAHHEVTVIESDPERADRVDEEHNVRVIEGSGSSAEVLKNAIGDGCDFFIALTRTDEINLIACSLARVLGARMVISRNHDQTYTDTSHVNYPLHFGIDLMLNPEGLCAVELAKSIRNPARVAVENFARGQIEAQRIRVDERAKIRGKALKDLKLHPEIKFGYYQRADVQDVPAADTVVEAGDILTVFGRPDELYKLRGKLDPFATTKNLRVVVFGGSETAVALLRLLNNPRFKVRVIERNKEKCRRLAERFPKVTFINGDGTSLRLLEEEQIGGADYFVASTSDDERNVMTSIQAAKLGAKHVQAVINKNDYEEILTNLRSALDIETMVSPRVVTANEVLRYLSEDPYIELFNFPNQEARILEIEVASHSPCAGRPLREIDWPPHAVVVALLHKFNAKVPGAEDRILGGDRVVVITREENIRDVLRLLRGR
ncbi:MAG: Trk system potassium transporter TrkA [Verrucomicrobia bacterium]|jgi:trk system potassium uptake protein TrkA|nr:Trk system potassium transporter TrkA [Verrucomicrobiota bacterium]